MRLDQSFGAFWQQVKRKQKARQRALDYAAVVNHLWKCMLKVYMHFHERFSKEYVLRQDSGATNEEEEEQKRAIFAHSEALTHIQKCLETRTRESLAQTLLSTDEASAHAKIFSLDFVVLLESLLR